jgi:hypothetical protein
MVQYEYGKNLGGKIIHISQVNNNERIMYFCIICDKELVPKTGDIKEHHFAHKNKNIDCSKEKYFQLLGKMIILEKYNECKMLKEPFIIKIKNKCKDNEILCKFNNYSEYNLIKYFQNIEMSNQSDHIISDLKVFNENNETIYIITLYDIIKQQNDYGNNRVIEILIKYEDDLKTINKYILNEENKNIIFHNFKRNNVV